MVGGGLRMTRNLLDVVFAVGKAGLSGMESMTWGSAVLLPALMLVATTAAGQQAPEIVITEEFVRNTAHMRDIFGIGADAAENTEDRLYK